jgi:hypothetical protein
MSLLRLLRFGLNYCSEWVLTTSNSNQTIRVGCAENPVGGGTLRLALDASAVIN